MPDEESLKRYKFAAKVWPKVDGRSDWNGYEYGEMYFIPQTHGPVVISQKIGEKPVTLTDEQVDDLIVLLTYYKQLKQEYEIWDGK